MCTSRELPLPVVGFVVGCVFVRDFQGAIASVTADSTLLLILYSQVRGRGRLCMVDHDSLDVDGYF
jgi:hypothetical protein